MNTTENDLTQVTTANGRYYQDSGGYRYPSVTTVLGATLDKSEGLTRWSAKLERELCISVAVTEFCRTDPTTTTAFGFQQGLTDALPTTYAYQMAKDHAADVGSETHNAIERYLKNEISGKPLSPEAQRAFNEFQTFWNTNAHQVVLVEELVYSKQHKYAGTADMLSVASIDGKPTIIDFKTSKYLSYSYYLQIAAYRHALTEMGYQKAEAGLIIKLPKTRGGRLELCPVPDLDAHFEAFLAALQLYNLQQEHDPWIKRRKDY